jgi:D-alanyl-D-alanine carboxypeptidase
MVARARSVLVVLLNTDEPVPGSGEEPSSAFGRAITQVISPDHVFDILAS